MDVTKVTDIDLLGPLVESSYTYFVQQKVGTKSYYIVDSEAVAQKYYIKKVVLKFFANFPEKYLGGALV